MVSDKSKRGSSRRKGDEYQDLAALRLALELYIRHQEYQLFINHKKAGSLDDIVMDFNDGVDAYQVKYAVNPNKVYTFLRIVPWMPNYLDLLLLRGTS